MSAPMRLTLYTMVATIAAALPLTAVFKGAGWVVPVVVAVALVSASCALIRWSPLPSILEPLTAAVAVLIFVTWYFAASRATAGFLPNGPALRHLGVLARSGFTDIRKLPTPVPAHPGLVLIATVGIAAVALVVDLLAVTLRHAAVAGLPLLALFVLSAATAKHGVNALAFLVAAVGFLMLLYADNRERVIRWGAAHGADIPARPAPTASAENLLPSAPASLGRRVGAAAIGLSVVVPVLIPGLHAGFKSHGGHGPGSGGGGGSVTTVDPIVSVDHDLTSNLNAPVLAYSTTTRAPGYLRLTSLDNYSGDGTFTASALNALPSARVSNGLPLVSTSPQRVTTTITVDQGAQFRWLPMPTTALSVDVSGDWRYDPTTATTFSASDTTAGLHYTVVSSPDLPSPKELAHEPATIVGGPAADLPHPGVSQTVRELTRRITATAQSKYDAALEIQRFLTGPTFHYTTTPPAPPGNLDALTYFLTVSRAGFCQQYATAMAVMARLVGIPSRVAVGFTAGTQEPDGKWLVTTHDAHAWPELYFPEDGWLAFEPTPRGDGQAVIPPYARALPNQHGTGHNGKTGKPTGPDGIFKPGQHRGGQTHNGGSASGGSKRHGSAGSVAGGIEAAWIACLVVLAAVVLVPSTTRLVARRRRYARLRGSLPDAEAAWAELRDTAVDVGAPWVDGRSPRQCTELLTTWIDSPAPIQGRLLRLMHAVELRRYAADGVAAPASIRDDLTAIRAALRGQLPLRRRLLTPLLPRSTRQVISGVWTRMLDRAMSRPFAGTRTLVSRQP
jgi:transglutaminase-like putative cysteine protease